MFGESAIGPSVINPMSIGTIGLLEACMENGWLAEACPVLYMFGESAIGPSVINPMSRGTIGLFDRGIGTGLLAMACPLV